MLVRSQALCCRALVSGSYSVQAVKYFESLVGKNVYALFFFAGHGFELNSKNYMMPVDADVEKNPEQCLCAQQVLLTMQSRGAKLSIVLLDMCRVNASTA